MIRVIIKEVVQSFFLGIFLVCYKKGGLMPKKRIPQLERLCKKVNEFLKNGLDGEGGSILGELKQ